MPGGQRGQMSQPSPSHRVGELSRGQEGELSGHRQLNSSYHRTGYREEGRAHWEGREEGGELRQVRRMEAETRRTSSRAPEEPEEYRGTGSEAGLGDHSAPSSFIHSFHRNLLRACCVPGCLAGSGPQGGGRQGATAPAEAPYSRGARRRQAAHSPDFFCPQTPGLTSRRVFYLCNQ